MPLPTASKLQLAMSCQASATLPRFKRPVSAAADRGTTLHAVVRAGLLGDEAPKTRIRCKPDIDALRFYLGSGSISCEVTYAIDVATDKSRFVGVDLGRDYGEIKATELAGTADIVALDGDSIVVVDIKTGKTPAPPAKDNWQLKFFAAALGGGLPVRGAIAYLAQDGSWQFDEYQWTPDECTDIRQELITAWNENIRTTANPTFENCRWCECICDDRDVMTHGGANAF